MKKHFNYIVFISIIMLIEAIIFLTIGVINGITWLIILGGVCCGLYVFLVDFYLLKIIKDKINYNFKKNGDDLKQNENEMLEEVNSSKGLDNYISIRTHQLTNLIHNWEISTFFEKVKLVCLSIISITGFVTIIVLLCFQYLVPCLIVFGVQCLIICGVILIGKIYEKQSLCHIFSDDYESMQSGKVIACGLHSQNTMSKGSVSRLEYESKYHIESKMTTRILESVYKIKVDLGDKKVIAFSKKFYNVGDMVNVCQNKKHKRIYRIVEESKIG